MATAQCISLWLPTCGPWFKSQALILRVLLLLGIVQIDMFLFGFEKNESKQHEEAEIGPYFKNITNEVVSCSVFMGPDFRLKGHEFELHILNG